MRSRSFPSLLLCQNMSNFTRDTRYIMRANGHASVQAWLLRIGWVRALTLLVRSGTMNYISWRISTFLPINHLPDMAITPYLIMKPRCTMFAFTLQLKLSAQYLLGLCLNISTILYYLHLESMARSTAHQWLRSKLGYECKESKKGMYVDGHERPDVIKERNQFIEQIFNKYER